MASELVSATQATISPAKLVFKEVLALPIVLVKLMVHANVMLVWPTTTVSAQSVPLVLFGVLNQILAFMYVVRILFTAVQLVHVFVIPDMAFKMDNAKSVLPTTSLVTDIVLPAPSTHNSTQQPIPVIAYPASIPLSSVSVLKNVELMKSTTPIHKLVSVCLDLEE